MAGRVLPGLFIGDCIHAGDEDMLMDLDITHIVSVGKGTLKGCSKVN